LASDGLPINEIARRLGVSKSSVSHWVRDIELTADQQRALRSMNPAYNRQINGARSNAARAREARERAQESGRVRARRGDSLHLAGCMLFLAEGSRSRNRVRFTNSDPDILRLFVTFLRTCFHVSDEQIRLTCNLSKHSKTKRQNRLPYGTCRIAVSCTELVQSLYGSIQEYGGFERPAWLE
jgi:AcrR family transcriptional regulator